jgi:hypothetical protein
MKTRLGLPGLAAIGTVAFAASASAGPIEGYQCIAHTQATGRVIGQSTVPNHPYPRGQQECSQLCERTAGCVGFNTKVPSSDGDPANAECILLGSADGTVAFQGASQYGEVCHRLAGAVPPAAPARTARPRPYEVNPDVLRRRPEPRPGGVPPPPQTKN